MNSGIQTNANDIVRHDTRLKALEDTVQGQAIALARIDENIKAIRSTLEAMATRP